METLITDIAHIDTKTQTGQLLLMALSKITTESQTDKTPNEVLLQFQELKKQVFKNE